MGTLHVLNVPSEPISLNSGLIFDPWNWGRC